MPPISPATFFGYEDPYSSPSGRSSTREAIVPTLTETLGAYAQETLLGTGSLAQSITATNIEQAEQRGPSISEQEWKESGFERPGITYYPTITRQSAELLATNKDEQERRAFIIRQSSGANAAAGIATGFLAGLIEPKNMAITAGVTMTTGGFGVAVPTVGRLLATQTVRGAAVREGVLNVAATAAIEPSNHESSRILQNDYTMEDTLLNFTMAAVLGAGLGGGLKHLEIRARNRVLARGKELHDAFNAEVSPTVRPPVQEKFSTIDPNDFEGVLNNSVEQIGPNTFEARIPQERGLLQGASGRGDTPAAAIADLRSQYEIRSPITEEQLAGVPKAVADNAIEVSAIKQRIALLDSEFEARVEQALRDNDLPEGEIRAQVAQEIRNEKQWLRGKLKQHENTLYRSLEPDIAVKEFDTALSQMTVGQVMDVTAVKDLERAKTVANAQSALRRKTPQERANPDSRTRRLIDESELPVNQESIKKFQDDAARSNNSSAYDPAMPDEIRAYLDRFGGMDDAQALERQLEELTAQVEDLRSQDLLNDDELAMLADLDKIDDESAIFDNVLLSARLCLTRN